MTKKYNQGVADSNRKRTIHGGTVNARQGKTDPLYKLWHGIKDRCFNPNHKAYHRYGGRGVTMCLEWANDYAAFKAFVTAMGERPFNCTLDRIDNNKGYEPSNVRWSTRKQQANNRATNVVLTRDGLTMTLMQWAEHLGWEYGLIASRWKKGLRGDDLFAPPEYERGKTYEYRGEQMTVPEISKVTGLPYSTIKWRIKNNRSID